MLIGYHRTAVVVAVFSCRNATGWLDTVAVEAAVTARRRTDF